METAMTVCAACGAVNPGRAKLCMECAAALAAPREIFARLGARPALEETEAALAGLGL